MDYQIVVVNCADGRVVEDVAIVQHSLVAEVEGHADIPFDRAGETDIKITHRNGILGNPRLGGFDEA